MVAGQDGKIWFIENCTFPATSAIGMVDPAHPDTIAETPIPTTASLRGIARTADGSLYFAEGEQANSNYAISVLTPAGSYRNHPLGQQPQFFAVDAMGAVWLAGEEPARVSPDGVTTFVFADNNIDVGCHIAAAADGIWYTGDDGLSFYSFALQRAFTYFIGHAGSLSASGVAPGGQSDAWMVQTSPAALVHLRR